MNDAEREEIERIRRIRMAQIRVNDDDDNDDGKENQLPSQRQPAPPSPGPPINPRNTVVQQLPHREPRPPTPRAPAVRPSAPPEPHISQRREPQHNQVRSRPMHNGRPQDRSVPPPMPDPKGDDDLTQIKQRIISRGLLANKYGLWFGLIGILCEVNSIYTTIVGMQFVWSIMFRNASVRGGIIAGGLIALCLFLGQIWNSSYEEIVVDDDDNSQLLIKTDRNKKLSYFFWLTPDAGFTLAFWLVPIFNVLGYFFFGERIDAESIRDIATVWSITWHHSWATFLAFFFLVLPFSVAAAAIFGVASAYYPEKALLGPRATAKIKALMEQGADSLRQFGG